MRTTGGRHLHHNFVVALLNDLFGIQARGGCSCAGPYGHALLGIDLERSQEFEREIGRGCEGIKPGWVRVNFNYFISDTVADYVIEAVRLVARDGWRLLGDYNFDATSGRWRHHDGPVEPPLRLRQVTFADGRCTTHASRIAPARRSSPSTWRRVSASSRSDSRLLRRRQRQRRLRPAALVRPTGHEPGHRGAAAITTDRGPSQAQHG